MVTNTIQYINLPFRADNPNSKVPEFVGGSIYRNPVHLSDEKKHGRFPMEKHDPLGFPHDHPIFTAWTYSSFVKGSYCCSYVSECTCRKTWLLVEVVRGAIRNVSGCQSHFYAHGVPWCFGVWAVLLGFSMAHWVPLTYQKWWCSVIFHSYAVSLPEGSWVCVNKKWSDVTNNGQ